VQAVVVVGAGVEEDPGELADVVEPSLDVDDRVEAQPAVQDVVDQLAAGERDREVDVERRVVRVVGVALNFLGVGPVKALVYGVVLQGSLAPVLLVLLTMVGRDGP
jgi:hypothetical protein